MCAEFSLLFAFYLMLICHPICLWLTFAFSLFHFVAKANAPTPNGFVLNENLSQMVSAISQRLEMTTTTTTIVDAYEGAITMGAVVSFARPSRSSLVYESTCRCQQHSSISSGLARFPFWEVIYVCMQNIKKSTKKQAKWSTFQLHTYQVVAAVHQQHFECCSCSWPPPHMRYIFLYTL